MLAKFLYNKYYLVVLSLDMKRLIIQSAIFSRLLDRLIREHKLLEEDYEKLEQALINDPKMGDVIPGMAGLRKTRLKSASKGKSGGFRIDYLDIPDFGMLHLIVIYPKNVKEDLSSDEKKIVLEMIRRIKKEIENG
jgi:hypothetical protein